MAAIAARQGVMAGSMTPSSAPATKAAAGIDHDDQSPTAASTSSASASGELLGSLKQVAAAPEAPLGSHGPASAASTAFTAVNTPGEAAELLAQQSYQAAMTPPAKPLTGEQVVHAKYGGQVHIESVLCRKLAAETALRQPEQRRHEQLLNMRRRSNVEAVLAHVTGKVARDPCKNCRRGHGPWTLCVTYENAICGSCTNCWFNASGARCTFHESNHHPPQQTFQQPQLYQSQPPAPVASIAGPVATAAQQQQNYLSQQQPSSQQQPAAMASLEHSPSTAALAAVPQTPRSVQHATALPNGVASSPPRYDSSSPGSSPEATDIGTCLSNALPEHQLAGDVGQAISRGMQGAVSTTPRQRLIARIEAAAKELGLRIAEYDEYQRTPQGRAERALCSEQRIHRHRSERAAARARIRAARQDQHHDDVNHSTQPSSSNDGAANGFSSPEPHD
ncbi:hypothetical protein CDD81_2074 [Ophiocordyceps australis]|uniref:Uncharacterized protein n=1 Tax=Ophiocordyceps australis TaxID=1399860 RepID=A0A2C5XXK1_9HYPO|nr:hypothetical protein CDD81_2074 [Ophiocordyceps australis]